MSLISGGFPRPASEIIWNAFTVNKNLYHTMSSICTCKISNINKKEKEKIDKYLDRDREVKVTVKAIVV